MRLRMRKQLAWWALSATGLICSAQALETSVGEAGINARRLQKAPYNVLGRKIAIGQIEIGRPGKFGLDKAASGHSAASVESVFHRNSTAGANSHVSPHANMVAEVMVSDDKKLRGVAPKARLYSSAVGSLKQTGQAQECLSTQHVAQRNGGDVRAINFSFGESLERDRRTDASLDGNALLTKCLDWSARVHNVVYVVAGNQGSGGIPIPSDNYNGVNLAYTTKHQGKYSKVDFANLSEQPTGIGKRLIKREIDDGARRAINLVAPGSKISLYNLEGEVIQVSGTSFAAPHLVGSVALLQEFGDSVLRQMQGKGLQQRNSLATPPPSRMPRYWSLDSRRHEVMKAVFLNSADKIQDSGNGLRLGMTRTTLTKDNRTWLESDAYKNPKIPLNMEMGTGHLNAFRAYKQFSAGQWSPATSVPSRGWDYRALPAYSYQDYVFKQPLQKGSFAAITLAWDRLVELKDQNNNQRYDVGEKFRDRGLNNLDIYLMAVDGKQASSKVCASVSKVDSVEHIFCPVPSTGRYKISVQYSKQVNKATQPYGLAWWTVPAK